MSEDEFCEAITDLAVAALDEGFGEIDDHLRCCPDIWLNGTWRIERCGGCNEATITVHIGCPDRPAVPFTFLTILEPEIAL